MREAQAQVDDEEKGSSQPAPSVSEKADPHENRADGADAEKTHMKVNPASGAPAMTDVFSWQHLEYTVTMPDGTQRRLLDDVSGYVAPGKLTALMGESGAGKVRRHLAVLGT